MSRASSRCSSAAPSISRTRNSERTEKSKPGSVSSSPRAYFQSIRARTASAAWRSESPSVNCITVTSAKRHGLSAGRPRTAKQLLRKEQDGAGEDDRHDPGVVHLEREEGALPAHDLVAHH